MTVKKISEVTIPEGHVEIVVTKFGANRMSSGEPVDGRDRMLQKGEKIVVELSHGTLLESRGWVEIEE